VNIDLKQLEALLKTLEEQHVSEFEFEDEKVRLHLKRGHTAISPVWSAVPMGGPPAPVPAGPVLPAARPSEAAAIGKSAESDAAYVTSPFVGTFYRASAPDAPPFVDVGSVVRPGQVLCIIEAMKLMNEIEAEFAGTILECLVENGRPIEFGQRLFKVKKS
jgi:acetyl-CoA carboxylase biotin carboxyl carrier protein